MGILRIEAYGKPETQGSMRGFVRGGRAVVTSDNKNLRPWRDTVTLAAVDAALAAEWERIDGPVRLSAVFWMPRPVAAPKTRDIPPVTTKDLDKLVRSVCDSLTNAGVWVDDNRICDLHARKRYSVGPDLPKIYVPEIHRPQPGVSILVEEM